jgi:hypothetical protein
LLPHKPIYPHMLPAKRCSELAQILHTLPPPPFNSKLIISSELRQPYSLWSLTERYPSNNESIARTGENTSIRTSHAQAVQAQQLSTWSLWHGDLYVHILTRHIRNQKHVIRTILSALTCDLDHGSIDGWCALKGARGSGQPWAHVLYHASTG